MLYLPRKVKLVEKIIVFNKVNINCVTVNISKKEYELCENVEMWSSKKPGFYGRGLLNKKGDTNKTERIGKLGEMAFGKIFKLGIDFEYKNFGDKFDFTLNGKTIDIKTASYNYGANCVQAIDFKGRERNMKCDIYVGSFLDTENRKNKTATIILVGWWTKKELITSGIKKARCGDHFNYELEFSKLHTIGSLIC